MRVHCVVTGYVRSKAGARGVRRYLLDSWREPALPVNAFLIEHAGGLCLFDTGQTARAAAPGWFPRWHPFFRLSRFELTPADEVTPALRALGFEASAVDTVVLSHLHTDHVGGLDAVTQARVIVNRPEWNRAIGTRGRIRGYLPEKWPAPLAPTLIDIEGPPVGPFPASFDLGGDGRMLIVPTPGHTPGHVCLLVRDDARSWLLAGDLAHTADQLAEAAPQIARWCRAEGVEVLTAHDPSAVGRLARQ